MLLSQNLISGKSKYLFVLTFILFSAIIYSAFPAQDNDGFDFARREILLRKIGHELLLQSGDSTSRVLPVKKISENEYQIRFENDFSFQPDSLVNITSRLLVKDPLTSHYIVKVLNCGNSSVAYAYVISKNEKDDIVACIGRRQPKACYMINIKFKPAQIITADNKYLLGSLSILAFVGFIFLKSVKKRKEISDNQNTGTYSLGSVLFDTNSRKLIINGNTIELTATETRILLIFASSPNKTVERNRLQKEIWEDDGIIVGRSLDMFISKLRKKLESDPNINIVVVRSKGYKLEIN
ncbi:winged helix-turn-helix domain-containing protein [Flavobacterium sp. CSZ]|uniref:winged helix-turn-helix domain-containing protein n=1 Tax=Flavobacterium sp. CSZ TaxID=2783791 RepID=UPI00188D5348|nr:winged helix-turn-helix domain-containing protein [Flavobacterium sp. CSZ]MBF4486298.1 winged helix-turn-helix transcriptional regulator [Flavobacterium sp. CSZ]